MNREQRITYKRNNRIVKTMGVEDALADYKASLKAKPSVDTENRCEINTIIKDGIKSGKSKLQVLIDLSSNPKYKQYKQYFRNWINDQYSKFRNSSEKEKTNDEQERD